MNNFQRKKHTPEVHEEKTWSSWKNGFGNLCFHYLGICLFIWCKYPFSTWLWGRLTKYTLKWIASKWKGKTNFHSTQVRKFFASCKSWPLTLWAPSNPELVLLLELAVVHLVESQAVVNLQKHLLESQAVVNLPLVNLHLEHLLEFLAPQLPQAANLLEIQVLGVASSTLQGLRSGVNLAHPVKHTEKLLRQCLVPQPKTSDSCEGQASSPS